MNLQQIQYVSAIAQYKSINKAAQHLFISQPSLSQALKDLEDEIGVMLFERSTKGVLLTENGIEFLRMSKNILNELNHLEEHYVKKNSTTKTYFQVSSQHYAFVSDAFVKFMNAHEDNSYFFGMKETTTLSILTDVQNNKSSLGVICMTSNNKNLIQQILDRKGLDFYHLRNVTPHVFLRNEHPLAKNDAINISDLSEYPVIVYEQHNDFELAEDFSFEDCPVRKIHTEDRGTLLNILANTNAYNIGTGYINRDYIPSNILAIPLKDTQEKMSIGWIHLKNRAHSHLTKEFVKFLKESLQ